MKNHLPSLMVLLWLFDENSLVRGEIGGSCCGEEVSFMADVVVDEGEPLLEGRDFFRASAYVREAEEGLLMRCGCGL